MSEDIRSKEKTKFPDSKYRVPLGASKEELEKIRKEFKEDLDKAREHLIKFVKEVLTEDNITPYKLSEKTNTHETAWKNFLDGRTKMPDMGAIVALADYKNVPLDKVIGRDISKERIVEIAQTVEMPAFMTKFPKSDLEAVHILRDKMSEFKHKPSLGVINETPAAQKTQGNKSFTEQVKNSNKPKGRSI
ncbi:hypothetical protein [Rickettsia hoogstraalii]|uniref:hypothetical protein n=1 Tax=Rickettsia hoogstraalii TaxID=467174 RepID=UPI00058FEA8D|nr:hypothetical protein [Rickettsia hoogstraalii]